jgi:hypothetical protein
MVITVNTLVLRGSSGVNANFLRLLRVHTQNFGKCEQSWKYQSPQPGRHSAAYVPYAWKPVSHDNRPITPSFLRSLFRHCREYLPLIFTVSCSPGFILVFGPRATWYVEGEGLHINITSLFESFSQ